VPTGCQPCRFLRGSDPIQGEETGRKIDEKTKGIVEEQYSPLDLKGVFPSEHAKMERVPPGEPTLFKGWDPKQKSRTCAFLVLEPKLVRGC